MRLEQLARLVVTVAASTAAASVLAPAFGCGASRSPAAASAGSGSKEASADAGVVDSGPPERPFAGSVSEATQLVTREADKFRDGMAACVDSYRKRKNLPHARVEVLVGIDQEGNVLGATLAKSKQQDPELSACFQKSLSGAVFPRSHAGVLSFTKIYEEVLR